MLALLPANRVAASEPMNWSEPEQIGTNLSTSWFPEIFADAAGTIRVVWDAGLERSEGSLATGRSGVMLSQSVDSGWSEPSEILLGQAGYVTRPIIVTDSSYAYLLFRTSRMYVSRAPLTSDLQNAHSWSTPYPLSSDESYWGQIVALPDGTVVTVFSQMASVQVAGNTERRMALFMRRSVDHGQTWGYEERLSDTSERTARSSLVLAPDGRTLLLAWDEGYDALTGGGDPHAISLLASRDGGATWGSPNTILGEYDQSVLATNGTTSILVYRSTTTDELMFRRSEDLGETWSEQAPIPGVTARPYTSTHHFDKLSLAVDGDGRILLSYIGQPSDNPDQLSVMVATFFAAEWTTPQMVATPEGLPEYPRICVGLGNQVRLVYFVRDSEASDEQRRTLWAVSATSSAQPATPVPYQAVSVETPVVTSVFAATPVPRPTVPSAPSPVSPGTVRTDSPQTIVIQPVLLLIASILASVVAVAGVGRLWTEIRN
ncbi:MAG TPA: exo-alpha-sialidase [Thermomicrobiales bacterium]|nr:exo-alpha-sialidase [Thermomicrobiales bacterium]